MILLIKIYKVLISPVLGSCCRFYPSCSSYAVEALQHNPLHKALFLISRRLLRCNPWTLGGYDPVKK